STSPQRTGSSSPGCSGPRTGPRRADRHWPGPGSPRSAPRTCCTGRPGRRRWRCAPHGPAPPEPTASGRGPGASPTWSTATRTRSARPPAPGRGPTPATGPTACWTRRWRRSGGSPRHGPDTLRRVRAPDPARRGASGTVGAGVAMTAVFDPGLPEHVVAELERAPGLLIPAGADPADPAHLPRGERYKRGGAVLGAMALVLAGIAALLPTAPELVALVALSWAVAVAVYGGFRGVPRMLFGALLLVPVLVRLFLDAGPAGVAVVCALTVVV